MSDCYQVIPIAHVVSDRTEILDDNWDDVTASIELDQQRFTQEALAGLDSFSHIEVIYLFHKVASESIVDTARHPRGRQDWPKVGIFAQRVKNRPNRLGLTTCRLLSVSGPKLTVAGLDAVDGTPVLDIKPVLQGFEPRGSLHEPNWASDIMLEYWQSS